MTIIVPPGMENDLDDDQIFTIMMHRALNRDAEMSSEYEAWVYITMASLVRSPGAEWYPIAMHLYLKFFPLKLIEPDESKHATIRAKAELEDYQMDHIHRLRKWIWKRQQDHEKTNKKTDVKQDSEVKESEPIGGMGLDDFIVS